MQNKGLNINFFQFFFLIKDMPESRRDNWIPFLLSSRSFENRTTLFHARVWRHDPHPPRHYFRFQFHSLVATHQKIIHITQIKKYIKKLFEINRHKFIHLFSSVIYLKPQSVYRNVQHREMYTTEMKCKYANQTIFRNKRDGTILFAFCSYPHKQHFMVLVYG